MLDQQALADIRKRADLLKAKVNDAFANDGVPIEEIRYEMYLNLRYQGTDNTLMIVEPNNGDFLTAFSKEHMREFSFNFQDRGVVVEDVRVRGIGTSLSLPPESPQAGLCHVQRRDATTEDATSYAKMTFSLPGTVSAPVYMLQDLEAGLEIKGPAILIDSTQTLIVEPNATAIVLAKHVVLEVSSPDRSEVSAEIVDPVRLSVFAHRFQAIAEQMGRMFQKVSVSTNIKERLDFSCAIFAPDGKLVANAPHVPVHLGSMEYAVRYQHENFGSQLMPGDHLCANHPEAGGTHLPDITIITPIWDEQGGSIIFYVASRGHHAEIGGIHPGYVDCRCVDMAESC